MNNEISRRQILLASTLAAAVFSPIARALGASGGADSTVDAGSLSSYAKDGVYEGFASQGFFVIRKGGRVVAQSSNCTHRRGQLVPEVDGFECRFHGSAFSLDGVVRRPPAKANLVRYAVSVDEQKHLIVDKGKAIEHSQFDAPGAYVEVSSK